MILSTSFFQQPTRILAQSLLGTYLVHETKEGKTIGKIVETEAYLGSSDPASHTYRGETIRNRAMFGEPGHAYIYFTYGMYYCFNITSAPKGIGEGILIRALEPIEGIEIMEQRRSARSKTKLSPKTLANGPAKLVIAMGITKALYGHKLTEKPLYLLSSDHFSVINEPEIITTTRIGISVAEEMPLRFYIKGNPFVSNM